MDNEINVVYACDNNYAQHAAVSMVSILSNTKMPERLHFYILTDMLSESNSEKLQRTAQKQNSCVDIIPVTDDMLQQGFVTGNLSRAAYYRLGIAELLPDTVDRVIYLDCDLLAFQDILPLWECDLKGLPLGAAEDYGILSSSRKRREKEKSFNWNAADSYFNSGVLLLDLKQWRQKNFTAGLLTLISAKKYRHHDQDVLNDFFRKDWLHLPLKWNVIPPVYNLPLRVFLDKKRFKAVCDTIRDIGILHYAGGYKPWEFPRQQGFNMHYYRYLEKSAFMDAKMPREKASGRNRSLKRQLLRLKWTEMMTGNKLDF